MPAMDVTRKTRWTLGLAALALSAPVAAQTPDLLPAPPAAPDDCTHLENGVQRLACYDALFDAEASMTDADDLASDETASDPEQPEEEENVMGALVNRYMAVEKALFSFSGSFVGHRPTYILPITWVDTPNPSPTSPRLGSTGYDYQLEHEEAKYQISFKVPLLTGLLDDRTTLWFGYTQQSFWQVYNREDSAPFRETNYEPEIFVRYHADWNIGGGTVNGFTLGFNHQSNGQPEPRSRSWNRIMGTAAYSHGRWLFVVQPWYRIPEDKNDDNADIEAYLGHANYQVVYTLTEDRTFSLRLMNNLRSTNRTSVEFGYSFPMGDTIKGFFQYYNGYGESLIDYNHRIERFGVGIMLNDWL